MKKTAWLLALGVFLAWQGMSMATTTVDALVQKLVEKGILTNQEATQIKGEISSDEEKAQKASFKSQLPGWVSNIKVGGDFRLRDQWEKKQVNGSTNYARNRVRIRARVNFEDQINDKVKAIIGIATDGGSARSNNETLGGNSSSLDDFGKAGVTLNKAYAIYTPNAYVTLKGGKMDNPLWEPGTMLWDPDITPEGGSIELQKKLNNYATAFSTDTVFVLHDSAPSSITRTNPYMLALQGGIRGDLTEKIYYKTAATWYDINNPSHIMFTNNSGTNTPGAITGGTGLAYNYRAIVGAAELGMNDPFGELLPPSIYIPQAGVFGEYANNPSLSKNNSAWMMGAYMGNPSINGWGTWKLKSFYKVVERDSWLDSILSDDFYGGDSSAAGWQNEIDIGLAKNVYLTVMYYHTHVYKPFSSVAALAQKAPQDLVQTDINFNF